MKPTFIHFAGNLLPSVYSGYLGNGDISLKALPFKHCNHSKQTNEIAFTLILICSERERATKAAHVARVLGQCFLSPICCPAPHRQTSFAAGKSPNFTLILP